MVLHFLSTVTKIMRNQYWFGTVATTPTNPFFPNYRLATTEDPKKQLWMDGVLKLFFYTPFKRRLHFKTPYTI